MNDTPRKTTVTLEDLLRLKRAERPPAEFWSQFERGMRAKQLAAIVEPRPWWAPFIRVGTRLARYQLPVGATAILAVTFLTIREYHPANSAPPSDYPAVEIMANSIPAPVTAKVSAIDSASAPALANDATVATAADVPARTMAVSDVPAVQPPQEMPVLGTASHVEPVNAEPTPSARYIAENLAAAQETADPRLDQMLGRSMRGTDSRPAHSEPLAQVNLPGESRRSRLLGGTAWLTAATTGDSALRTNDQATRRLSDRRLSESEAISRIDVGGDRFTLKF